MTRIQEQGLDAMIRECERLQRLPSAETARGVDEMTRLLLLNLLTIRPRGHLLLRGSN